MFDTSSDQKNEYSKACMHTNQTSHDLAEWTASLLSGKLGRDAIVGAVIDNFWRLVVLDKIEQICFQYMWTIFVVIFHVFTLYVGCI